ncbi:MAG: GIY-YIG nuclease family protein, partial [Nitrosotalea sp.]
MAFGVVYKITNKINNKAYVGQTVQKLSKRIAQHRNDFHRNRAIGMAMRKYGMENFSIEVLCNCDSLEDLNIQEYELINKYNTIAPNGYNLRDGGNNSKMSDIAKQKLSIANTGKKQSTKTIQKRSMALIGHAVSSQHLERLELYNLNRVFSSSTRQKMATAKIGQKQSPESIQKRAIKMTGHRPFKVVGAVRIDPVTHEEKIYEQIIDAKKDGFNNSRIVQCCRGKELK